MEPETQTPPDAPAAADAHGEHDTQAVLATQGELASTSGPDAETDLPTSDARAADAAIASEDVDGLAAAAPSDETPSAPAAEGAAVPEPALIEVWRMHRHQRDRTVRPGRGAGRPAAGGRDVRRAPGEGAQEGQAREARASQDGPRDARGPVEGRGPRADPRRTGRPDARREAAAGPQARGGARAGVPPRAPSRAARSSPAGRATQQGERREGERPFVEEPRRERRERAPDPDSPFAKLAALKAQLEARDGKR